jgi:hypothetical protein
MAERKTVLVTGATPGVLVMNALFPWPALAAGVRKRFDGGGRGGIAPSSAREPRSRPEKVAP